MGGWLCNGNGSSRPADESGEKNKVPITHPPSVVEMKHGHICRHSEAFLEQQDSHSTPERSCRKGHFYHPKIDCLDAHPARRNTHIYVIYGGMSQDNGKYIYLIDEHNIQKD